MSVVEMYHTFVVYTGVSDWQAGSGDSRELPCSAALQVSHAPEMSGGGELYYFLVFTYQPSWR